MTASIRPSPREPYGSKHNSRCNAVRHGLIAETVIGALEDSEDEAPIIADYDAKKLSAKQP
jgi:hypothetical protein